MKILYYDCFCGISGDMNLGALIDLGVDKEYLLNEISKLNISSEYEIKIEKGIKNGISGTKVDVIIKKQDSHSHIHSEEEHIEQYHTHVDANGGEYKRVHSHNSNQEHEQHNHNHDNNHSHQYTDNEHHHTEHDHQHEAHDGHHHHEDHGHRNLKDIEKIINSSDLSESVKNLSLAIFMRVAEAEAEVHGKSIEEVHFHEVGAIDSIIDIVGAAIAIDYLKVDKIMASTVQLGGGFVKCAHGLIPVPAPATIRILKGIPVKTGIVNFETTTPTGAAILAENVDSFTDKMEFEIKSIGYGLGTRELDIPNVLRVYLGEQGKAEEVEVEEQFLLETNIDDMNPEIYAYIEEKLFSLGALDVFKTPIIMKKGRPAIKLSVLTNSINEEKVLSVIFKETTSIGIRKFKVEKVMLKRDFSKVDTTYGQVTVKNSYYKGELVKAKAEYEDCKKIAIENDIPLIKIYGEVSKLIK
jgi:uncharacterized protein (TIGR00299 family) protein